MKNSAHGFVTPLLLGVVALLLIGAGAYVYASKDGLLTHGTQGESSTTTAMTIDEASLTSDSLNPLLTGTAHGLKNVYVSVSQMQSGGGSEFSSKPWTVTNGVPVGSDGSWQVSINPDTFSVSNGPGFVPDGPLGGYLPNGSYSVTVYDSSAAGTIGRSVSGTLVVNHGPAQASATIDPSSLTSTSGVPTITGTYTNTNVLAILVSREPLAASMPSISKTVWAGDTTQAGGVSLESGNRYSAPLVSGDSARALAAGTYYVGVYNECTSDTCATSGASSYTLLASGKLIVH